MCQANPLDAIYNGGQFVVIDGESSQEYLDRLGCYGTVLNAATRKDPQRRGPLDRYIVEKYSDPTISSRTILSLNEAYFLSTSLKCLRLKSSPDSGLLNDQQVWALFRQFYLENMEVDFAVEYAIYHYFRTSGWVVKGGDNYGSNFLLYKKGPSQDHASFAVKVIVEGPHYNWNLLLTLHRVAQSVSKQLLLAYILEDDQLPRDYTDPISIKDIKISYQLFEGNVSLSNS